MKTKIFYITTSIILALFLTNCEDEEWAEIDSLSAYGDEFYTNQQVKLWMCVNSSNLMDITYEWGCDGGSLVQPQGLDEMTWKAPVEPGNYNVYCKVTTGGKTETRYHEMNVTSFFFEKFESSTYPSFSGQSSTKLSYKTETSGDVTNGYLEAYVNSTSSSNRYLYYKFAVEELNAPFGCMAKVGWLSDFPLDTITVKSSVYANKMAYSLILNRTTGYTDEKYIDNIRFEWFPVEGTEGYPIDTVSGLPFNGTLTFEENNLGSKTWYSVNVYSSDLIFDEDITKNVDVNIDDNYMINVYVDGNLVLNSGSLKQWRDDNSIQDKINITEWRFIMPNGEGGKDAPIFYFDDAYAAIDGTLLTGN